MSDAATESRDDDPSALTTNPDDVHDRVQVNLSTSPSAPLQRVDHPSPQLDSASHPPSAAHPSASTSPGAQTPQPTSTVSTLQLASDALSTIPQSSSVPTAAAELLSAIHRRNKKAPAVQSPHPGILRSRSLATTPVPPSLLLGVKNDSLDVTANSSRATTPTRTPSGRAKRQRRERNPATPTASVSALPSIDQNDRRRSARVAKAVTATASDSPSLPNLALFGFSPYLENLVLNAKDSDRRTRSGGRGFRPPIERGPTKLKRTATKNKTKEADPDGPDDDAKLELYRQLCIISYQLQAHLDMVPHKSLAQLHAHFGTPSPEDQQHLDAKLAPSSTARDAPGASLDPSRATTPAANFESHVLQPALSATISTYTQPVVVKAEPPQSPPLSMRELPPSRPAYSPESSPEVALMDTVRPSYNGVVAPYYPTGSQGIYQPHDALQADPYPWTAVKADEPEDEPMSPVFRPRGNIMSISALMSGPSSSKQRSPSPELIQTPPRPTNSLPIFMQEWTDEDQMASQFLQACADAIPKLDTTELDRLTQIAQLAAFDLEMLSVPSSPRASTTQTTPTPITEQQRRDASAKFDPKQLDPLKTLDTQQLYDREEAEYLDEMQGNHELYENVRYLSNFDDVVDEWRAGELARLRLQLEMRKAEVDRIWTCDRKLAWSTFIDNRAGELYRKAMAEASHSRWQAEMELDLVQVYRRKTRGLAKLTSGIWLPRGQGMEDAKVAEVYKRYGKFVSAAKYPELDDPLVRADVRKMRTALLAHKRDSRRLQNKVSEKQADANEEEDAADAAGVDVAMADAQADAVSVYDSDSAADDDSEEEPDYDSDSSYVSSSSGISSLPSFSSVSSSPHVQAVDDAEVVTSDLDAVASEVASVRGAEVDSDEDADESLWARQMRLATQLAEHKDAPSAIASIVQTPAVAAVADGDIVSALPSRAASPVGSIKAQARKQQRENKRKKRPPPPGARLWKKGRVQHDGEGADGEQADGQPQDLDPGHYPNGDGHYRDTEMADVEAAHGVGVNAKMQSAAVSQGGEMLDYDYRREPQPAHMHHQAYNGYGMRPSYLAASHADEYEYGRSFHPEHLDAYSSGARGYPAYSDPYAHPSASYPAYPQDMASRGYGNGAAPQYGHTPPLPDHMVHGHLYAQYDQGAPARYPSHPPPTQQGQQQGAGRPQWPY
ncbi:conserved hypothetical protein [Sporisorium reilianum SRZ2]|uniref:Uncharacterized protein n=1 Tax=Sporisorium reilianum (strain SRZ2) TaxID=999809 RepID=E6ZN03_SPORE|nr:conserved hypothetical protein [Sporisorium reilianum SRZ2]